MNNVLDFISKYDIDNIQNTYQNSNETSVLFIKDSERIQNIFKNKNFKYGVILTDSDFINKKYERTLKLESANFLNSQKIVFDNYYKKLNEKKKYIGVTGTNGKTTVTSFVHQILLRKGFDVLLFGTLGIYHNKNLVRDLKITTPSYLDIRKTLNDFNYDFAVFEASSHALEQDRFHEINFDVSAWTNLTQDHLDYHKSMDEYFKSKKIIIEKTKNKKILLLDNKKELIEKLSDCTVEVSSKEFEIDLNRKHDLGLNFNQENLKICLSILETLNIQINREDVNTLKLPEGRSQFFAQGAKSVCIDYAHTPDALLNITKSLKNSFPDSELITLFGCGGDRDKKKRPRMLEAVSKYSDIVFLTSDNPRYEDPDSIIKDTLSEGKFGKEIVVVCDRAKAIKAAMETLDEKKILLVAGKGHENYILEKGKVLPYSDKEEVLKYLYD